MKAIDFRGFDLQAAPYKVVSEDGLLNSPLREIISYELARSDNAVAVFRRYGSRDFTLRGTIITDSEAALELAIDQLKYRLLNRTGDVGVAWGGGTRYFASECKNVVIARGTSDIDRCAWSAGFFMAIPFSTDNVTRDFITDVTGHTTGSLLMGVGNVGTYLAFPYITLTLTAIEPNIGDVTITLGNPSTNENISFTDEFADGDVITIDTYTKQIFKGATLLAGAGQFPAWLPEGGLLEYNDTATSRTINIEATYIARYL